MTRRPEVHVVFTRQGAGWIATVRTSDGLAATGRTIREARRRMESFVRVVYGEGVRIQEAIDLPPEAAKAVERTKRARTRAEAARREAQEAIRQAIGVLTESVSLSGRDTAEVLELSHQRVQQLIAASRNTQSAK